MGNKVSTMAKDRKEPQPTFDFTKVGRDFSKEWNGVIQRTNAIAKILSGLMPEGNSREQLDEFEILHEEYHQRMVEMGDEQGKMICKILESVPKNWLMEGAPAELDFSELESLDWIQADRYAQLLQMIGEGRHFRESAKN